MQQNGRREHQQSSVSPLVSIDLSIQGIRSVRWSVPVCLVPVPGGSRDHLGLSKLLAEGNTFEYSRTSFSLQSIRFVYCFHRQFPWFMTLFVFLFAVINSISGPDLLEIHLCISTAFNQEEGQSNIAVYSRELQETSCQHIVSHRFQRLRFGAGFLSFKFRPTFLIPWWQRRWLSTSPPTGLRTWTRPSATLLSSLWTPKRASTAWVRTKWCIGRCVAPCILFSMQSVLFLPPTGEWRLSCRNNPLVIPVTHDLSVAFYHTKAILVTFVSRLVAISGIGLRSFQSFDPITISGCQSNEIYNPTGQRWGLVNEATFCTQMRILLRNFL